MSALSPVEVVPENHAKFTHIFNRAGDVKPHTINFGALLTAHAGADLLTAAEEAHEAFQAAMSPFQSDDWTLQTTIVRGSPDDGGFIAEYSDPVVGGETDSAPPENCALLVEKRSMLAGKQNRGRVFIPGCPQENAIGTGGGIDLVTLAAIQVGADAWLTDLKNGPIIDEMVLFHADFIRDNTVPYDPTIVNQAMVANPDADTPTVVTVLSVDQVIATQRRRMR